ncbi:hypothetical protein YC2023_079482 [Brassica napus]
MSLFQTARCGALDPFSTPLSLSLQTDSLNRPLRESVLLDGSLSVRTTKRDGGNAVVALWRGGHKGDATGDVFAAVTVTELESQAQQWSPDLNGEVKMKTKRKRAFPTGRDFFEFSSSNGDSDRDETRAGSI